MNNIEEVNNLSNGRCHYFNTNAASVETIEKYIPKIKEITNGQPLKLLLHSIAFGTTTNFFGDTPVTPRQMDMTVHVMGNSLLYWTQHLFKNNLLAKGSRVMGLTSEGNYLAMEGYGPVSVAKVAMEAIIRQIGWELGEFGVTANAVQAGITYIFSMSKISAKISKNKVPRSQTVRFPSESTMAKLQALDRSLSSRIADSEKAKAQSLLFN